MAKKLIINCAGCDIRKAVKENYDQYESITVNASVVLTNASGKEFINAVPITMNCANVLEVEDNVEVRNVKGHCEIKNGNCVPDRKFIMQVNGSLTIGPNTENYLQQCVGLTVNGSVMYPESMAPYLGAITVNGSTDCYPDGAIVLKRNTVIDHLFALRAKKSLYWCSKRMIMTDPELEPEQLHAKGVTFASDEVIISKSKVEAMIDLIDENSNIIIVPDGTAVIMDDITLDSTTFLRYGERLYIIGDVTVPAEDDCLDHLQYLVVRGDAVVPQERKEKLLDLLTSIGGDVEIAKPKGAVLKDKLGVKITKWMLEQQPLGIDVRDCMVVKIKEDVSKELIMQRLHIQDCGVVKCTEEQEDAVAMVSADVGQIGPKENDNDTGVGYTIKSALAGITGASDTKVINAADYVM